MIRKRQQSQQDLRGIGEVLLAGLGHRSRGGGRIRHWCSLSRILRQRALDIIRAGSALVRQDYLTAAQSQTGQLDQRREQRFLIPFVRHVSETGVRFCGLWGLRGRFGKRI